MRVFSVCVALFVLAGSAGAQAPSAQPMGSLAQIMRGIFFPNANLIFDVQTRDPEAHSEETADDTATSKFSGIYAGWPVVENAALVLAEATHLITMPGRLCQNGRPVPTRQYDWNTYAQDLRETGWAIYQAAKLKNQAMVSDLTNDLAGACENCHFTYRDKPDRCIP